VFTPGGYATMGLARGGARRQGGLPGQGWSFSLVGDGGFGQNPAVLASAFESDIAVIWVVMIPRFRTIAGLNSRITNDLRHGIRENGASYSA